MDFSVIAACRGRHQQLRTFIESLYDNARRRTKLETIIMADNDDLTTVNIVHEYQQRYPNIIVNVQPRSPFLNRDYINKAANFAAGKYLWVLGNDIEVVTKHWDVVLYEHMERFLDPFTLPHGIAYCYIDDDIHAENDYGGCCFPVITRQFVKVMGFCMPPELTTWSADHYLWQLFSEAAPHCITKCFGAKLHHWCHHTGRMPRDEINHEVEQNWRNYLTESKYQQYLVRLKEATECRRNA